MCVETYLKNKDEGKLNKIKYIYIVVLLLLSMCVNIPAKAEETNNVDVRLIQSRLEYDVTQHSREYLLGPNDILSVFIYDEEEFDREKLRIQPDGNLVIAPLGQVKAAGRTIDGLQKLLVQKYKFYLKDPQITIRLDQVRPFMAYITGNVLNPGGYELNMDTSAVFPAGVNSFSDVQITRRSPLLSNLLVAAGGAKYDSDFEHIKITNSNTHDSFEVNLMDILENREVHEDIYLMAGDVINVPKLPTPLAVSEEKYVKYITSTFAPRFVPVRVFGYVQQPGLVKLDSTTSITLNSALMAAGGYLTDAAYAPKRVYISRADASGKLVTKKVNPMVNDIAVMPNDIIYVPEKARPLIAKAFDAMAKIITPVNMFANSYNNWALMFNPTRYQVIGK